jgi:hypothetical protein
LLRERTAVTRDLGERAYQELTQARSLKVDDEDDKVTAEEWLKLEEKARVEDDEHRPVHEEDLEENQLLTNEAVDDTKAGVIAVSDDGLPDAVPSDEDVAVGVMKTQLAYEKAADEASLEEVSHSEPAAEELDYQAKVQQDREAELAWQKEGAATASSF